MSIGVALIGSGIFVKEEHLPAVLAAPTLTLKAVYSRSLKSATALELPSSIDIYSDDSAQGKAYSDLLLRPDIHAVIIALPILTQPTFIRAALLAGKHVLSEKPVAGTIKEAQDLIHFYNTEIKGKGTATWAVAENFRYLPSFEYARSEARKLGRVLSFQVKMHMLVHAGTKYFETPWRKKPEYQGGFVLDGGVHFVAATRLLLGEDALPTAVTAYSTLLQEHLPPVDTVNALWITKSGISGTWSTSFGTTLKAREYTIACEKGSASVTEKGVTVWSGEQKDGKFELKAFDDEGSGVKQEVVAWGKSIEAGKADPRQSPEEALADLEILEKMLRSGEANGKAESLSYQI